MGSKKINASSDKKIKLKDQDIEDFKSFFKTLTDAINVFIANGVQVINKKLLTNSSQEGSIEKQNITINELIIIALGKDIGEIFIEDIEGMEFDNNNNIKIKLKKKSRFSNKDTEKLCHILNDMMMKYQINKSLAIKRYRENLKDLKEIGFNKIEEKLKARMKAKGR